MFRVESASGIMGTCALIQIRDEQYVDAHCLIVPTSILRSTSSAKLCTAKFSSPLRATFAIETLAPEWVQYCWNDAEAGLTFVELSPPGHSWALSRGATSHTLASPSTAGAHSLTLVRRSTDWYETRKKVLVKAVKEKELQLSRDTFDGMLLDTEQRLVACVTADTSKTAVRIDNLAADFLKDRKRLYR